MASRPRRAESTASGVPPGDPAAPAPSPHQGLPIRFTLVSGDDSALLEPALINEPLSRAFKISETVAQRVVADIVAQGLRVGDHLPGENEMLQQYAVSRESLREGLRLLEVQGLITIRRGPGGGPVVAAVDPRNLARISTLFFHLAGANYDELFDAWQTIEPAVVRQVTESRDRATKKAALAPFLREFGDSVEQERFVSNANGFHAVMAQLSGNRVLTLILQAVSHIVVEHVMADLDPLTERTEITHSHEMIGRAIIDGRANRAAALMAEHIGHVNDFYRSQFPDRVKDLIQWR